MIKKCTYFLCFVLTSPMLMAQPVNGMIAGPAVMLCLDQDTHDYTNTLNQTGETKKTSPSFGYGGSVGYIYQVNGSKIVAGVKADVLINTASYKGDLRTQGGPLEGKFEIKSKYTMGFNGLVGAMVNPKVCLFARIGYQFVRANMNYQMMNMTGASVPLANQPAATYRYKKWVKGLIPGAGAFYVIDKDMLIWAEYGYFLPQKVSPMDQTNGPYVYQYNLRSHYVGIKLFWKFES